MDLGRQEHSRAEHHPRGAFDAALAVAKTRIVRGIPIIEYQVIARKLADMAADIEAAEWLVYYGAPRVDQGTIDSPTAAKLKLVASEMRFGSPRLPSASSVEPESCESIRSGASIATPLST